MSKLPFARVRRSPCSSSTPYRTRDGTRTTSSVRLDKFGGKLLAETAGCRAGAYSGTRPQHQAGLRRRPRADRPRWRIWHRQLRGEGALDEFQEPPQRKFFREAAARASRVRASAPPRDGRRHRRRHHQQRAQESRQRARSLALAASERKRVRLGGFRRKRPGRSAASAESKEVLEGYADTERATLGLDGDDFVSRPWLRSKDPARVIRLLRWTWTALIEIERFLDNSALDVLRL